VRGKTSPSPCFHINELPPDPELATVENLSNAANSILMYFVVSLYLCRLIIASSPPLGIYSRRPTVSLPKPPDEKGGQDELGDHVEDLLHRRAVIKRTLRGVWSFLKTRESGHRGRCFRTITPPNSAGNRDRYLWLSRRFLGSGNRFLPWEAYQSS
jgi:hypothetical protein